MPGFVVPPDHSSRWTPLGPTLRRIVGVATALWLVGVAASEAQAVPRHAADGTTCARYASPRGSDARSGGARRPFRTVQRLVRALRPGQTGCLMRGTYHGSVYIENDRIELASVARSRARLRGHIWIKDSANGVTLSHLSIDGHDVVPITVQVHGDDALLRRLNITNRNKRNSTSTGSCLLLGHYGTPAFRTRVVRSRIHNCGGGNSGHDHGIYSEFSRRAVIRDNYIYDNPGFGISMYPDTQYALIEHNVIDGNAYENRSNVTFSGEEAGGEYDRDYASSNNVLRRNIISNSRGRHNVESFYPSLQPTGNLVARNCVWNAPRGNFGERSGYRLYRNRIAPPRFRDRAGNDFRLRRSSRCRGFGPRAGRIG
jgi:Right handed beta helix region